MSISTMKRLTVLASREDAEAIVRKLMNLKCVQITKSGEGDRALTLANEGETSRPEIEARLSRIRAALSVLSPYSKRKMTFTRRVHRVNRESFLREGRDREAQRLVDEAIALSDRLHAIREEQTRNETLRQSLLPWLEYDAPLGANDSRHTRSLLGSVSASAPPVDLIAASGAYVETVSGETGNWYLSVTYHNADREAVEQALATCGFVKASFEGVEGTAQKAYDAADAATARLETEVLTVTDRLQLLAESLDDIEILSDITETDLNVCIQKQKLLTTRSCSVLEGWIPENMTEPVIHALSKLECACELSDPEEGEEPPVLLHNNPLFTTFEWVIAMYSYPKYGTFDPTLIMSIFYFLIFGMMFADVGYGLLLVIACFGGVKLLNPRPGLRRMMLMFGYCGISCIFMGVLFGGWFGDLPTAIINSFFPSVAAKPEFEPVKRFFNGLINPITQSTSFLVVSLAMGEIHLVAGMAVNMVLTWKKGERLEAICSTVPFWILYAGLDLLAPSAVASMFFPGQVSEEMLALFSTLSTVGLYVTIAGFAAILFCRGLAERSFIKWLIKGLGGLYSLISFASDMMSYSRILALGLVAGVIAQVINMLTGLGASGPIGFFFMLIIMIVGHGLNLAINLLGTFVHAARLQYIEFFGKFYEDGGEIFDPALPAETYSEDVEIDSI